MMFKKTVAAISVFALLLITIATLGENEESQMGKKGKTTPQKHEENPKTERIKKQDRKVLFFDEKGKLKKDLDLKAERILIPSPEAKKGKPDRQISRYKDAFPSPSNDFLIVRESDGLQSVTEKEEDNDASHISDTGRVKYYDINGDLSWKKEFTTDRVPLDINISENGSTIAVIVACVMECTTEGDSANEPSGALYIFNRKGEIIHKFPNSNSGRYVVRGSPPTVSPNGRYIAVDISDYEKSIKDKYFNWSYYVVDIKNNTTYIFDECINITTINNNGMATIMMFPERTFKTIDLKKLFLQKGEEKY
ncbi:MAG TPA: hypothetical protein PKH33_17275 [bacterium]|nr:hypothetical protein [bacterium]